jgi:hypothetical protein
MYRALALSLLVVVIVAPVAGRGDVQNESPSIRDLERGRVSDTGGDTTRGEPPRVVQAPPAPSTKSATLPREPLPTGTIITRRIGLRGHGQVTINNENKSDAVVSLFDASGPYVSIYVASGKQATVAEVPEGTYEMRYTLGEEWDGRLFRRHPASFKLEQPLSFKETVKDEKVSNDEIRRQRESDTWTIAIRKGAGSPGAPVRSIPTHPLELAK